AGGCNKVSLIFPILIIHNDDYFSLLYILNSLFYGVKFYIHVYVYVFVKVTLLFAHSYNALVKYDLVLFRLSFRNQKRELLSYFLQELFSLHFVVVHIKY